MLFSMWTMSRRMVAGASLSMQTSRRWRILRTFNPQYSRHFGAPTYEVCNSRGFEFGNDDEPGTAAPVSFHQHLAEWIKDGSLWFDPKAKPSNWSLEEQLQSTGIRKPAQRWQV
jgi:hypothetical protein